MVQSQLLSIADAGPGTPPPVNFWDWFSTHPDNDLALAVHYQPSDHLPNLFTHSRSSALSTRPPGFRCTSAQLREAVERLATILYAKGLREGDVVAVFVGNAYAVEWTILLWASWRIGAAFAPVEPGLLSWKQGLSEVSRLLNPKVILLERSTDIKLWEENSSPFAHGPIQLFCTSTDAMGQADWTPLSQLNSTEVFLTPPQPVSAPEQPGYIIFTSGTTSTPKGCPLTFANVYAEMMSYRSLARSNWSPQTTFLATSSVFRPLLYYGTVLSWTAGGSVVFGNPTFQPVKVIEAINAESVSHLFFVPTQLRAINEVLSGGSASLKHELEFVGTAGDMSDERLVSDTLQTLKTRRFIPHWGMSEGCPLFGWTAQDSTAEKPLPFLKSGQPGIGRPLPGTRAKICPASGESTEPVPTGIEGELHVYSESNVSAYLGNVSSSSFYEENSQRWFRTGDLAIMKDDGIVYVVGRIKDIIMCKGFGILPSTLEKCLMDVFGVEALVTSLSDPAYGEKPIAVVKSLPTPLPNGMRSMNGMGKAINGDGTYLRGAMATNGMHAGRTCTEAPEHEERSVTDACELCGSDGVRAAKQSIIEAVPAHLGSEYILGEIYTLEELHLKEWPENSSGKLDRRRLRSIIKQQL